MLSKDVPVSCFFSNSENKVKTDWCFSKLYIGEPNQVSLVVLLGSFLVFLFSTPFISFKRSLKNNFGLFL